MKKYHVLLFAACILTACHTKQNANVVSDSSKTAAETIEPVDTHPKDFKGLYASGSDGNTFQDCEGQKTYWLEDSTGGLKKKYEQAIQPLPYANESVYAEVKGYLSGKSKSGLASEYENVLVVTGINKVEAKNFRTECYPYEFIALGNEPFWSLDLVPAGQQIILKDLGKI